MSRTDTARIAKKTIPAAPCGAKSNAFFLYIIVLSNQKATEPVQPRDCQRRVSETNVLQVHERGAGQSELFQEKPELWHG